MIGQVAALRKQVVSLAELHSEVSVEGTRRLAELTMVQPAQPANPGQRPSQVAIVGISAMVPGAHTLQEFWENVLNSVYAIGEVPKDRWDADLYFDGDRKPVTRSTPNGAVFWPMCPSIRWSSAFLRTRWRPSIPCTCWLWWPPNMPWPMRAMRRGLLTAPARR